MSDYFNEKRDSIKVGEADLIQSVEPETKPVEPAIAYSECCYELEEIVQHPVNHYINRKVRYGLRMQVNHPRDFADAQALMVRTVRETILKERKRLENEMLADSSSKQNVAAPPVQQQTRPEMVDPMGQYAKNYQAAQASQPEQATSVKQQPTSLGPTAQTQVTPPGQKPPVGGQTWNDDYF